MHSFGSRALSWAIKERLTIAKKKAKKTKKPTKLIKFGEEIVNGTFSGELRQMYNVV